MKHQLKITYKDGSGLKVTNNKSNTKDFAVNYFKDINIDRVQSAVFFTYPLKNNKPLVLVEEGVPKNDNVYEFMNN